MLKALVRIAQIAFFGLGAVALALWLGIGFGGGRKQRSLEPFQRTLAESAARDVARALPQREEIRTVIVGPVAGDLDGQVAELLADEIDRAGYYDVVSWEDAVAEAREREKGAVLGDDAPERGGEADAEAALKIARVAARATGADGWVRAEVSRSSGEKGLGAHVDLAARFFALPDAAEIPGGAVRSARRIETRASLDYFAPWMEQVHPLWRLFLWALFCAGLPFAAYPIVQAVTARESNRANAALLGALVLLDVAFAAALMGFRPGWGGAFLLAFAALVTFVYNFAICDRIDEMRK